MQSSAYETFGTTVSISSNVTMLELCLGDVFVSDLIVFHKHFDPPKLDAFKCSSYLSFLCMVTMFSMRLFILLVLVSVGKCVLILSRSLDNFAASDMKLDSIFGNLPDRINFAFGLCIIFPGMTLVGYSKR